MYVGILNNNGGKKKQERNRYRRGAALRMFFSLLTSWKILSILNLRIEHRRKCFSLTVVPLIVHLPLVRKTYERRKILIELNFYQLTK